MVYKLKVNADYLPTEPEHRNPRKHSMGFPKELERNVNGGI